MSQEPKKIKVVDGNGENLDISEVSTHISGLTPKSKNNENKQEIVIPLSKKKSCKKNKK